MEHLIVVRPYYHYRQAEVLPLYRSVGWSAYYDRPAVLEQAFANARRST